MVKTNLNKIIDKVTKGVLSEISISQKKRNARNVERSFRKPERGLPNGIKQIVVLTAENPDSVKSSNAFNKKSNKSLFKDIKDAAYGYVPAIGKFGNVEHPYAVFNMSLDAAKYYSGKYQQTSFVITYFLPNGTTHSEYWEKADITKPYAPKNPYIKKDECDEWVDMSNAEDNFTIIGKKFKYSIPFSIFESVDNLFSENLKRIVEAEKAFGAETINEERVLNFIINHVGKAPYIRRKALITGFNKI